MYFAVVCVLFIFAIVAILNENMVKPILLDLVYFLRFRCDRRSISINPQFNKTNMPIYSLADRTSQSVV